jgi:hypothetical protein
VQQQVVLGRAVVSRQELLVDLNAIAAGVGPLA